MTNDNNQKPSSLIIPPPDPVEDKPKRGSIGPHNCTMCRHFHKTKVAITDGDCLRYPPVIHLIGMQAHPITQQPMPVTHQFVPQVGPMFVCGEFSPQAGNLQ